MTPLPVRSLIRADLVDHMGSDLSVVNAARVSFAKEHAEFDGDKDTRLLRYLATQGHWSPFAHVTLSLRCAAPIFVARQMAKHQVGLAWNEVSRRYVDDAPVLYVPDTWRGRAENAKQGSSAEAVDVMDLMIEAGNAAAELRYRTLLAAGVCPEQARMVLPQSMMTEWIWTGSLYAFARVCSLRLDPHTQKETRVMARDISFICETVAPISWGYLSAA